MRIKSNKGFSLVELIIVIAIMGVLVGSLAPQMMKYVEKARLSSDAQFLDTVYQSVTYAMAEPAILQDAASTAIIASMSTPMPLEDIDVNSKLGKEIINTLGWSDLNQTTYEHFIKSSHASDCQIYLCHQGGVNNPFVMWITTTDNTRGKDTSKRPTQVADIGNCINIQ